MMRATMVIALAAACGSVSGGKKPDGGSNKDSQSVDAGNEDGAKSGTRLKLQWVTYPDGARQLAGIMDTMLHEQCYPQTVNGGMYCAPSNSAISYGYYSDANCTQAVAAWYYCNAGQPDYIYTYDTSNPCQSTILGLYQRGSEVSIPSGLAYEKNAGGCQQVNFGTNYTFYGLGAPVAVTTLATMERSEPSGSSGIGVVSYTSTDGLVYPELLHDSTNNYDCYPETTGAGATSATCVPDVDDAYAGYYSNSTCTTAVAETNSSCPVPTYAEVPGQCSNDLPTYFQLGSTEALSTAYYTSVQSNGTTTCQGGNFSGVNWYMLGAAVPTQTLTRAPEMVAGRRIQRIQFTAGSTEYPDYALYDTTEQLECESYSAGNNTYNCLPTSSAGVNSNYFYSDSACANAVDIVELYRGANTCPAPVLPKYALKYTTLPNGCSTNMPEVHTVGASISTLYYKSGTTCTVYPAEPYEYYLVGAQVPTANFATATLMTDP
ncbi:MAG TPA: hypothetical protein VLX92_24730 [Kofleriaceae bacterium]|nr:hypothetical protein [Kofleriaceae bacterium]